MNMGASSVNSTPQRNKNLRIYSTKSLLAAKYQLLDRTYMVDYRNEVYRELHDLGENENEPGMSHIELVFGYSRDTNAVLRFNYILRIR